MQPNSVNHQKPLQFDAIHQILLKQLGNMDENHRFATYICHEHTDEALDNVIYSLLEKEIHIHRLLTVLSACEKSRLQHAFGSTSTLPPETQLASANIIINHFNSIQEIMLEVAERYFQDQRERREQNIASIQDTGNRSIQQQHKDPAHMQALSESIDAWVNSKTIMVHNYYHGLAIRARVDFYSAEEGKLRIQFNEELARIFAAHPHKDIAFALCKDEDIQVRLRIEEANDGSVLLHIDDTIPAFSESRQHLNVQVLDHVPAMLTVKGKRRPIQGQVHDLSMGGLGVTIQGINESPCNISDKIECEVVLNQKPLMIQGVVRWTGVSDDEARIGIEINDRSNTKQYIQKEIFRIQRNIITTIKQLDIPEHLAKAIRQASTDP